MLLQFIYKTKIDKENKLMVVREKGGEGKITDCVYAQTCPALCDSMDCSPPDSSVHGIVPARILEWVAIPSSRRSSNPGLLHCRQILYCLRQNR